MHIRFGKHAAACVICFCLTQLNGCSFTKDVSTAKDSTQSAATNVPTGATNKNSSYTIKGKRYYVLNDAKGYHKQGMASWYGKQFHGKRTSSNEKFNLYGMTAASPVLPLHSYIKVTNLQNGKQVIVKVNDRGPFKYDRVLDLSYAAAKKLGYVGRGIAMVDIEAIDATAMAQSATSSESAGNLSSSDVSKTSSKHHNTKKHAKKYYAQNGSKKVKHQAI